MKSSNRKLDDFENCSNKCVKGTKYKSMGLRASNGNICCKLGD